MAPAHHRAAALLRVQPQCSTFLPFPEETALCDRPAAGSAGVPPASAPSPYSRASSATRPALNALSALYPTNSQEKRLLDGMLLAVPR